MRYQVETSLRRGWLSVKVEAARCVQGEGEGPSQYNVRGPGQIPAWAPSSCLGQAERNLPGKGLCSTPEGNPIPVSAK